MKASLRIFALLFVLGLTVDYVLDKETTAQDADFVIKEHWQTATFAGGCFWCVESDFEKIPGVEQAISGYSGGEIDNPTYKQVAGGKTKHTEAVQVHFDPEVISYAQLLQAFWRQIDPTDDNGQFVDRGKQYRPAIFFHDEMQKQEALASVMEMESSGRYEKPINLSVEPLGKFFEAESYHQDFYTKSPARYKAYRYGSGRDQYLKRIWGEDLKLDFSNNNKSDNAKAMKTENKTFVKPSDQELREKLTDIQYKVTQKDGTERPFTNEYHDEKRAGIYVDIVSGEPLFSSLDKFDSGTGWPSFSQPLISENIITKTDYKLILPRTEVRSANADSHLGHVFKDGPAPTGLRYCMNSAAMRFIAKEDLEQEGYAQFASLFE